MKKKEAELIMTTFGNASVLRDRVRVLWCNREQCYLTAIYWYEWFGKASLRE